MSTSIAMSRHAGPPLGIVAIIYTLLFIAGLYPVTIFGGAPYFPGPWETPDVIKAFFEARPESVFICAFFHFGASIALGIFTATVVSRLHFLGVRAAGAYIALFGGLMTAFNMASSAFVLWAMAHPGIVKEPMILNALYYLSYGLGGPGFAAPFGLLIAGVSIPAAFLRLMPKWIVILGIALGVCGELSALNLIFPSTLFFIPLTRFPGFIWLIAAGFALPSGLRRAASAASA
jgi:hypothetical protein